MRQIGIGVIGTGFMGKAHAFAYRAVSGILPGTRPELEIVADVNRAAAERAATQLGFRRHTDNWQDLVADPAIGIVSITTPNIFHREMALAAIAAGKHIHCEKPLAPSTAEARDMMEAAEAAGIVTQVGYNYIKNPLLGLAREMITSGELGEITGFRGIHAEDYMANPDEPYSWRVDPTGGQAPLLISAVTLSAWHVFSLVPLTRSLPISKPLLRADPLLPEPASDARSRSTILPA